MSFFELISQNNEIGLVIKPKKIPIFNKLKRINTYIHESIKKNKPIYLINDNNVQLNNLKNEIDLVVNISFYTPTILIESIILGFRSICYDYSNIFNFEKKLLEMDKE